MRQRAPLEISRYFEFEKLPDNVFRTSNLAVFDRGQTKAAYGGVVMAQALAAAELTMSAEFKPHSIHSYFILNVDTKQPVEYHVRILRDGRSFATRSVEAFQAGKAVFCLQASFHKPEPDSCSHQSPYPHDVTPAAECLPLTKAASDLLEQLDKGELIVEFTLPGTIPCIQLSYCYYGLQ